MILEEEGAISHERGTPVGSKEVRGKLLNSIDLQGGETFLWFRTEALLKLLKEMKREIAGDAWSLRKCLSCSQGTRHRITSIFLQSSSGVFVSRLALAHTPGPQVGIGPIRVSNDRIHQSPITDIPDRI